MVLKTQITSALVLQLSAKQDTTAYESDNPLRGYLYESSVFSSNVGKYGPKKLRKGTLS